MKKLLPFLFLLLPLCARADSQNIGGSWGGLNDADTSIMIGDTESQDLLNVDITENGYGIRKREGVAQYKTIGSSTWPVRGGAFFRDVSGNQTVVHSNDHAVYKSVSGGAYAAFLSTDTAGSYYDFVDSNGYLWRATSNRDEIMRYDGSAVTWYPNSPKGTQIEVLPDRLVIAGTAANPNRVSFSGAADFTDFTPALEDTSPFYEEFGMPGQDIRAIKYALERLLVWTNDTFSYWAGTGQFDGAIETIDHYIGCTQPYSVVTDGSVVYWQAQDRHFYSYDGNLVRKISRKIAGSVNDFAGGSSKQWLQTTEADFDDGTATDVSWTVSGGELQLSTFTQTDTSADDFGAGTPVNLTTATSSGDLYLAANAAAFDDPGFETGTGWSSLGSYGFRTTYAKRSGTYGAALDRDSCGGPCSDGLIVGLYTPTGSPPTYVATLATLSLSSSWTQFSVDLGPYAGQNFVIGFNVLTHGAGYEPPVWYRTILGNGNSITLYARVNSADPLELQIDDLAGTPESTIVNGSFVSQSFDTNISTPAWLTPTVDATTNGHTITFETQASSDGASWDSLVAWSTPTAPTSASKQYIRYKVTMSTASAGTALPYLSLVTLPARAWTGIYESPTKNLGGNATAFRNFTTSESLDGGTISWQIRTAATEGALASAAYEDITNNTQIGASINAWVQLKSTMTITASTQAPATQDYSIAWDEGTVVPTFGAVDKDHRILWSVGEGASTVPNATYIYDTRFDSWLKYDQPFQAAARVGDSLYFGGVSTGVVYNWPSGNTDDGAAITAYWKSKDFISADPFTDKAYTRLSLIAKAETGSNLDITYTVNTTSSTSFNISLTDPNSYALRRYNRALASGTEGTFFNLRFGNDDADAPFEMYLMRYDYTPGSWQVLP